MRTLGNVLWHFPFFGFVTATFTWLLGGLLTITVIAAPVGLGLMEYGKLLFWPFGNAMISKSQLNIEQNKAWKTYSIVVTILYFPFGLFLTIFAAIQVFILCLSIIGIPAAMVIAKSLSTFLNPVNKKCVHGAVAAELERRKAQEQIDKHLGSQPTFQTQTSAQQESNSDFESIVVTEDKTVASINSQLSKNVSLINENSNFNTSEFTSNKKKVFIGGIVGVLLIILAIKFVISLDFVNSKTDEQQLQSTQPNFQESSQINSQNPSPKYEFLSARSLTASDIENMNKYDLKIMRNEIYARYGYIFKSSDMKAYFESQIWYTPKYDDVTSLLTEIEKRNVELIKRYE